MHEEIIEIGTEDLEPHETADRFWPDDAEVRADVEAIAASIAETRRVEHPLLVTPCPTGGYFIVDGIARWRGARAAGLPTVPCRVRAMTLEEIEDTVFVSNMVRRRFTAGQRVVRYLELHRNEVLLAAKTNADPSKTGSMRGNSGGGCLSDTASSGRGNGAGCVSDTASSGRGNGAGGVSDSASSGRIKKAGVSDTGFSGEAISERIGVSKKDVLQGIMLLRCVSDGLKPVMGARGRELVPVANDRERDAVAEAFASVETGATPIRRWQAALAGKVKTKDTGKAPTDYSALAVRSSKSLRNAFENWGRIPFADREIILDLVAELVGAAPDDVRGLLEKTFSTPAKKSK